MGTGTTCFNQRQRGEEMVSLGQTWQVGWGGSSPVGSFLVGAKLLDTSHEQQRFLFWKLIFILKARLTHSCLWEFIWPLKAANAEQKIHSLGSSTWRSPGKVISPQGSSTMWQLWNAGKSKFPKSFSDSRAESTNSCSWLSRDIPHWGGWYSRR